MQIVRFCGLKQRDLFKAARYDCKVNLLPFFLEQEVNHADVYIFPSAFFPNSDLHHVFWVLRVAIVNKMAKNTYFKY